MTPAATATRAAVRVVAAAWLKFLVVAVLVIDVGFAGGEHFAEVAAGVAILVSVALMGRGVSHRRRLRRLLGERPRSVDDWARNPLSDAEDVTAITLDAEDRARLLKYAHAGRLVLVKGPEITECLDAIFDALGRAAPRSRVLMLSRPNATQSRLAALLGVATRLPFRRDVLCVEDAAALIKANVSPITIEGWLAANPRRMAVGAIRTGDLEALQASGHAAAIGRVEIVTIVGSVAARARHKEVARAFTRFAEEPHAMLAIRGAIAWRLLITTPLGVDKLVSILDRVAPRGDYRDVVHRLLRSAAFEPGLEGLAQPHAELVSLMFQRDHGRVKDEVVAAVMEEVWDSVEDLTRLSLNAKALKDPWHCRRALRRAGELAAVTDPNALLPLVVSARESLRKSANAAAAEPDFRPTIAADEHQRITDRLKVQSDDVFDLGPEPLEIEDRATRGYRLKFERALVRVAVLAFFDCLAASVAIIASLVVRHHVDHGPDLRWGQPLFILLITATVTTTVTAARLGLYRAEAARARLPQILTCMATVSLIVATVSFAPRFSRSSITAALTLLILSIALAWAPRYAYDRRSRRWVCDRELQRRLLLMGTAEDVRTLGSVLVAPGGRPVRLLAFLSDAPTTDAFHAGDYASLEQSLQDLRIDELVIVDAQMSTDAKAEHCLIAHRRRVDVLLRPTPSEVSLGFDARGADDGLLRVPARLLSIEAFELKRRMDRLIATILVPVWSLVIALYAGYSRVRRKGQPVLVTVPRVGAEGNAFDMYRLRTRKVFPDRVERGGEPQGRVEEWVEKWGVDEIPQVINVLRDEMSMIGPRPVIDDGWDSPSEEPLPILGAKPGMTGLWQIRWSAALTEAQLREYDAAHLRHWRVTRDLDLLLRTVGTVLSRRLYLGDSEIERQRESYAIRRLREPTAL